MAIALKQSNFKLPQVHAKAKTSYFRTRWNSDNVKSQWKGCKLALKQLLIFKFAIISIMAICHWQTRNRPWHFRPSSGRNVCHSTCAAWAYWHLAGCSHHPHHRTCGFCSLSRFRNSRRVPGVECVCFFHTGGKKPTWLKWSQINVNSSKIEQLKRFHRHAIEEVMLLL